MILQRNTPNSIITAVAIGNLVIGSATLLANDTTLMVTGWPSAANVFRTDRPDENLGDDPVIGRQACPALLRFNAGTGKMETVLLKKIPQIDTTQGVRWVFDLRPGLRWWNGSAVTSEDLHKFLERELHEIVNTRRFDGKPSFLVQKDGDVEIRWDKNPPFGPNILAGHSFWRSTSGKKISYECAGLYAIEEVNGTSYLKMVLSKGYKSRYAAIQFTTQPTPANKPPFVAFSSGGTVASGITNIPSRRCDAVIDVPYISAIIWNPQSKIIHTPALRQAMTHAIPRGEILRTAAGDLGSLLSGPILRSHEGYNAQQSVRPFNLDMADALLTAAGYKQAITGSPRTLADGKPFKLNILRAHKTSQELLEKIISDSWASLGIEVTFQDHGSAGPIQGIDGVLSGISLPWPSMDLSSLLRSGSTPSMAFPFFIPDDKQLDEALDSYALSLASGQPQMDLLHKVHSRFFELEAWSVILGHQSCIKVAGLSLRGKPNLADPDWFRKQVVD